MDIPPSLSVNRLGPGPERPASGDQAVRTLLAAMKPGQSLNAQVLTVLRADLAQLLIDGQPITARTGRPLTPGQQLTLTVLKAGAAPELEIREAPRLANGQAVLRQALPRQLPLLDTLRGLQQTAERAMPLLTGPARQALRSLIARDQPLHQPGAAELRQAVRDSGLFTEARLARGQAPTPGDRKSLLLQLSASLPPRTQTPTAPPAPPPLLSRASLGRLDAPPEPLTRTALLSGHARHQLLLQGPDGPVTQAPGQTALADADAQVLDRLWRLVEASLARIHTHQAASLPRDDGNTPPAWQLEIPIALPGGPTQVIDLRIQAEAESDQNEDSHAGWLVTIGFVFAGLGPVKAGVRLAGGRISTSFWCEQASTAHIFDSQLPRLRSSLEAAGLEVGHLAASQGVPPETTPPDEPRLLDERV